MLLDDLCGVGAAGAVAVSEGNVAPVHLYRSVHPGFLHGRPAVPGHVRPVPAGGGTERGSGLDHLRERESMGIVVNLDVMMAKRKMSLGELAQRVDITMANLSILKTTRPGSAVFHAGGHL